MTPRILRIKTAPGFLQDETHFLFHCPVYTAIRQNHIAEFTDQEVTPLLETLLGIPPATAARKVAMYIFHALKRREERLV